MIAKTMMVHQQTSAPTTGAYSVTFASSSGTTFDFTGKGESIELVSGSASVSGMSVTCAGSNAVEIQVNYDTETQYDYTFDGNSYISGMTVTKVSGTLPLRTAGDTVLYLFRASGLVETEGALFSLINPTDIRWAFLNCTSLSTLGSSLLEGCSNAVEGAGLFENCAITSIPSGLLDDCVSLQDVSSLFRLLPITTVPADVFQYTTSIIRFAKRSAYRGCFDKCTSLTTIPQGFQFPASSRIFGEGSSSYGTFTGCTALTSIPNNLCALLTSAYSACNFSNMFYNTPLRNSKASCPCLTTITARTMFPSAWSDANKISALNTCFGTSVTDADTPVYSG